MQKQVLQWRLKGKFKCNYEGSRRYSLQNHQRVYNKEQDWVSSATSDLPKLFFICNFDIDKWNFQVYVKFSVLKHSKISYLNRINFSVFIEKSTSKIKR